MATLRASEIFKDPTRKIIAVESIDFRHTATKAGGHMYGNIRPLAVIVCGQDGAAAFDMSAQSTSLETLKKDVPELDAMIALS